MHRRATAVWEGTLKRGRGKLTTQSGVLSGVPYSFGTRFEHESGPNPEELIAVALAGCFNMALAAQVEQAGFVSEKIKTDVYLSFEKEENEWSITRIELDTFANVPGATQREFQDWAEAAKRCPVARSLKGEILLNAKLKVIAKSA